MVAACRAGAALMFFALAAAAAPPQRAKAEASAQLCLLCHKAGNVTAAAPLLEGQPAAYLLGQITAYQAGRRKDPAMQSNVARLTAREARAIASYFERLPLTARFPASPQRAASGKVHLERHDCAGCHRPDFRGAGGTPRLAGQNPAYLAGQLRAFADGSRSHPSSITLDAAQAEDVAAYFATLE